MKWLCTLLAFMVLILSVQPVCASVTSVAACCDGGMPCDEETGEEGQDHRDDCNGCNPFQLCSCCAFSVLTPYRIDFSPAPLLPVPPVQWGVLSISITRQPASDFWQPPRA